MTLANNYISHYRTRKSRQRRLWTWVYAGLAVFLAMVVYGADADEKNYKLPGMDGYVDTFEPEDKSTLCPWFEKKIHGWADGIKNGNRAGAFDAKKAAIEYATIYNALCKK